MNFLTFWVFFFSNKIVKSSKENKGLKTGDMENSPYSLDGFLFYHIFKPIKNEFSASAESLAKFLSMEIF